jgi:hypothetical protein
MYVAAPTTTRAAGTTTARKLKSLLAIIWPPFSDIRLAENDSPWAIVRLERLGYLLPDCGSATAQGT